MYVSSKDIEQKYSISRSTVARTTRLMKELVNKGVLPEKTFVNIGRMIRFDESAFLRTKANESTLRREYV